MSRCSRRSGAQPLAVTTNLTINFLRKPGQADLIADARLMKVGKRLAVGEVTIYSEGADEPVAHVTSTYSIPNDAVISRWYQNTILISH